jgi:hypothetical protein
MTDGVHCEFVQAEWRGGRIQVAGFSVGMSLARIIGAVGIFWAPSSDFLPLSYD